MPVPQPGHFVNIAWVKGGNDSVFDRPCPVYGGMCACFHNIGNAAVRAVFKTLACVMLSPCQNILPGRATLIRKNGRLLRPPRLLVTGRSRGASEPGRFITLEKAAASDYIRFLAGEPRRAGGMAACKRPGPVQ